MQDFETFYTETLLPSLQELKQAQDATKRTLWVAITSAALAVAYFVIFFVINHYEGIVFPLVVFIIVAMFAFALYMSTKDNNSFSFKESIIARILKHVHPATAYVPNQYINSKHYKNCGLYLPVCSNINGDDYFNGTYKFVTFKACELNTNVDEKKIFSGLFFAAKISNYFNGGTYIVQKGNTQYNTASATAKKRQYDLPVVQQINTGDEVFDANFDVYSTIPTQSTEILNDYRRKQLINFKNKVSTGISMSFVAGHAYACVPMPGALFEASKDIMSKAKIKDYFFNILIIYSIIDKLKLEELQ